MAFTIHGNHGSLYPLPPQLLEQVLAQLYGNHDIIRSMNDSRGRESRRDIQQRIHLFPLPRREDGIEHGSLLDLLKGKCLAWVVEVRGSCGCAFLSLEGDDAPDWYGGFFPHGPEKGLGDVLWEGWGYLGKGRRPVRMGKVAWTVHGVDRRHRFGDIETLKKLAGPVTSLRNFQRRL